MGSWGGAFGLHCTAARERRERARAPAHSPSRSASGWRPPSCRGARCQRGARAGGRRRGTQPGPSEPSRRAPRRKQSGATPERRSPQPCDKRARAPSALRRRWRAEGHKVGRCFRARPVTVRDVSWRACSRAPSGRAGVVVARTTTRRAGGGRRWSAFFSLYRKESPDLCDRRKPVFRLVPG